jgi:hypothetical protein
MQRSARVPCWSGKLKYFGSEACELVEARAGVSGQQDPAGCGGSIAMRTPVSRITRLAIRVPRR